MTLEWFVDVNDNARIHVAALLSKSVTNERIFASGSAFTWNDVFAILRKLYPSKKFADDIPNAELSNMRIPTERGVQLLRDVFGRPGWTSLEETVAENVKGLA
jgi:nucleoside-diphosphate-sugar epimerase